MGGVSCFRERRKGARKRKSVRGCIVASDIAILNLVVTQKGEQEIEGLTDTQVPVRLGPKRASKIRKLFNLNKEDDVRKYVIRRKFEKKEKTVEKAPKIQRLVTPLTLQRKRARKAIKVAKIAKSKGEAQAYVKLLQMRLKEKKERRSESIAKKRAMRDSQASQ